MATNESINLPLQPAVFQHDQLDLSASVDLDSNLPQLDVHLPLELDVDLPSVQISRRLSLVGKCLLLIYLLFVVNSALPIEFFSILWQIKFSTGLVEHAPIALLGAIMIALAIYLDPGNEDLVKLQRLVSRFCLLVSIGFLLLIPLRIFQVFAYQQTVDNMQDRQAAQALASVNKIKTALQQATSREDLEARLRAAKAPALPPALRQRSLPELRDGLSRSLSQVEERLQNRRRQRNPSQELNNHLANAKMMLSALLYGGAFAAFGQRSNTDENFLDEVLLALRALFVKVDGAPDQGQVYLDRVNAAAVDPAEPLGDGPDLPAPSPHDPAA
jgi:hypothetical protein